MLLLISPFLPIYPIALFFPHFFSGRAKNPLFYSNPPHPKTYKPTPAETRSKIKQSLIFPAGGKIFFPQNKNFFYGVCRFSRKISMLARCFVLPPRGVLGGVSTSFTPPSHNKTEKTDSSLVCFKIPNRLSRLISFQVC